MKEKEFKYRRDWGFPAMAGTMIVTAVILYLGISFGHHSHIFDGRAFSEHYLAYAVLAVSTAIAVKFWYDVFDNTIVLLINSNGVRIRRELLPWHKLAGYKMLIHENYDGEGNVLQYCIFDFADETSERTLDLGNMDIRMDEIVEAITRCSVRHSVVFRGYETIGK
jgi:hypothetical protein